MSRRRRCPRPLAWCAPASLQTTPTPRCGWVNAPPDSVTHLATPSLQAASVGRCPPQPRPAPQNVINQFTSLASDPRLSFLGNVRVGRDVGLSELRPFYNAVVLCYGAESDRRLGVPGEVRRGQGDGARPWSGHGAFQRQPARAHDRWHCSTCAGGQPLYLLDEAEGPCSSHVRPGKTPAWLVGTSGQHCSCSVQWSHGTRCKASQAGAVQDLPGVLSAREFVWWYNGHPQYRELPVDLSRTRSVAIAGLGNVAGRAALPGLPQPLCMQPGKDAFPERCANAVAALRALNARRMPADDAACSASPCRSPASGLCPHSAEARRGACRHRHLRPRR